MCTRPTAWYARAVINNANISIFYVAIAACLVGLAVEWVHKHPSDALADPNLC